MNTRVDRQTVGLDRFYLFVSVVVYTVGNMERFDLKNLVSFSLSNSAIGCCCWVGGGVLKFERKQVVVKSERKTKILNNRKIRLFLLRYDDFYSSTTSNNIRMFLGQA